MKWEDYNGCRSPDLAPRSQAGLIAFGQLQNEGSLMKTVKNHNRFTYCLLQPELTFNRNETENFVSTDSVRQQTKIRNPSTGV